MCFLRRETVKHFRQYIVARSVEEAVALRREVGPRSLYIAGGTTVVPFASSKVDVLVDIAGLGLDEVAGESDSIRVGATAKLAALLRPEVRSQIPALARAASEVGSPLLRNMATLGGSLAGLYLPSDVGIAMLAAGAKIGVVGDNERTVRIEDLLAAGWLSGPELITHAAVARPRPGVGTGFAKFGRSAVDIALVNAAVTLEVSGGVLEGLKIAIGQSWSQPSVLTEPSGARGREVTSDLIRYVSVYASESVKAKSDAKASADFRKDLVRVMVARALKDAAREVGINLAD
jgi:CO/xanthine dehydrogenase FAD-binding subunit